ncbi:MAG: dihydroorotate dehydrogenase electron transfer subunit [Spirochaetes bacterium]|nr:dihydroorotate dehydrogenase electron transfer subunit [Spirochaetota bacterium]
MATLIDKPLEVCKDHYLLKIDIGISLSHPGQFANIKIGKNDPLLRRPFSIFDHKENIIEIIFKVVGKGTEILKNICKAGYLDVIAPLGQGFSITENKNTLLIGGGVGNAPLYYLAKQLKAKNNIVNYLYAARSKDYIFFEDKYRLISNTFYLATDDGSGGRKGTACDISGELAGGSGYDIVYTCGPAIMMAGIVRIFQNPDTRIEVSLENYFGCGIGLCSGCAVETNAGIKRACVDGPAFDGRVIDWGSLLQ